MVEGGGWEGEIRDRETKEKGFVITTSMVAALI
jgi:hypothetical protein